MLTSAIFVSKTKPIVNVSDYEFSLLSDKNALDTPVAFLLANGITPNHYVAGQNLTAIDWLFTDRPHYFGLIPGWANPTGVLLLVVLIVMFICSMKWVRKGGYFEVQYNIANHYAL